MGLININVANVTQIYLCLLKMSYILYGCFILRWCILASDDVKCCCVCGTRSDFTVTRCVYQRFMLMDVSDTCINI